MPNGTIQQYVYVKTLVVPEPHFHNRQGNEQGAGRATIGANAYAGHEQIQQLWTITFGGYKGTTHPGCTEAANRLSIVYETIRRRDFRDIIRLSSLREQTGLRNQLNDTGYTGYLYWINNVSMANAGGNFDRVPILPFLEVSRDAQIRA